MTAIAPMTNTDRMLLIEQILTAARTPIPKIVESRELKGTDGLWYWGEMPRGVDMVEPAESRVIGYVFQDPNGTRYGTRAKTEQDRASRWRTTGATRKTGDKTMTTYTTTGSVRGNCGHSHKSIDAAYQCLRADQKGCGNQGGYSDRSVVRSDGESLTEQERTAYEAAQEAEYGY